MQKVLQRNFVRCQNYVRFKHKENHWSVQRKKVRPADKAMEHFNDFYKQVFGKEWESIRNGLTNKPKYVAIVNNYGNVEETVTKLENRGAINMRTLFNLEKQYNIDRTKDTIKQKTLEKVYQMDEEMTEKFDSEPVAESTESQYSLESSLKKAALDDTRIIDTRNELSNMLLQEFIPTTKIKGKENWVSESSHYSFYDNAQLPIAIEKQYDLHFPEYLNVFSFEYSNHSDFRPARRDVTGVFNYYLMDGGSLLPVLALGLKPGHTMLDLCASPGGKTMLALQTLYPNQVIANDYSFSRVGKIKKVLDEYFYDLTERFLNTGKINMTCSDGRDYPKGNYDCILVDVPCTNDRLSLRENENNIFSSSRIKERLKLPVLQSELLVKAMELVKIGGTVVYSTCTLSPVQNDGVVQMSLNKMKEENVKQFSVIDLSPALKQTSVLFKYADQKLLKFGHLVVPFLPLNFGPTYFCKLKRIK